MAKSPGHRKRPDHKVLERHLHDRIRVEVHGEQVAESSDVIRVDEDDSPPRYYFPRSDVAMEKLERTETTTTCPFKGTAHYFTLKAGGEELEDAVWTYEDPHDEHRALKDRVAFYEDAFPALALSPRA